MKQICIKIYLANPLVVHFANIPQECGVLRWKIVIQNCSTLIVDVIWQGAQVPLEARGLVLRTDLHPDVLWTTRNFGFMSLPLIGLGTGWVRGLAGTLHHLGLLHMDFCVCMSLRIQCVPGGCGSCIHH